MDLPVGRIDRIDGSVLRLVKGNDGLGTVFKVFLVRIVFHDLFIHRNVSDGRAPLDLGIDRHEVPQEIVRALFLCIAR